MPAKKTPIHHFSKRISSFHTNRPKLLLLLVFFIGFCTHILISVIFAETKDGVIHACANKRSGELRIITNYKDYREGRLERLRRENREDKNGCRENEMALDWNKEGPPGPQGPAGSGGGGSSLPFICPSCEIFESAGDRLSGKDLSNAVLQGAQLQGANVSNTNFTNANLKGASLDHANLSHANLENADMSGAQTEGTNFEEAKWNNTTCPDGTKSQDHDNTCQGHFGSPPQQEEEPQE